MSYLNPNRKSQRRSGGTYYICPFCDANLDPGEICDCRRVRFTTPEWEKDKRLQPMEKREGKTA